MHYGLWNNDSRYDIGYEQNSNGQTYSGEYNNGKYNGIGTYIWKDNTKYEGEWKDNSLEGYGIFYFTDGRIYIGMWKENKMNGYGELAWKDGKKFCGFYKDDKRNNPYCYMIGYVLNEAYWGKGIMSEVLSSFVSFLFNSTNINLLTIYHFPNNNRSRRVIEKCGFKYEGILRDATLMFDGKLLDNVCYSLKKDEFIKK